jgi:hypothetical protein
MSFFRRVNHPNHFPIKSIARPTLFGFEVRVLELDHPTTLGLHICDVPLAVSVADDFLPMIRKLVLPGAVPLRLVLPPRIANVTALVGPVSISDFSPLPNHRLSAARALARKAAFSFLALTVDERVSVPLHGREHTSQEKAASIQ